PADPGRLRIDSAGGALYAAFPSEEDGTIGLRSYNAYDGLSLLEEYELDAGVNAVDFDPENGLVYVAHDSAEGGLSMIDVLTGTTTRISGGDFAVPFSGVAVDGTRGLIYATSAEAAD
ncbi:hypothetical protein PU560_00570, partial [Georgenia sp. 10Sc9-8]|nr:hypothetical protein [Georgenia halotolerans]